MREIGVRRAQHQVAVVLAGVDFNSQIVARTKGVLLADAKAQSHFFSRRKTRTQRDAARWLFGHGEHQIDLIGGARDFDGFHVHVSEKTQTVNPVTRQADLVTVVPSRFVLTELATDHFVAGAVVARDQDAPDVSTARRFSLQHKLNTVVLTVNFWLGLHLGKSKTKFAEVIGEGLGGLGHGFGVVGLAHSDLDQRLEFIVLVEVVAFELHTRDHKTLTLGHVDRDGHFLFVGRHGHLGGINPELQKTTGQIIGAQGFEVGIELGAGIAVGLGVPAHPAPRVQVELVAQIGLRKRLVAHNLDLFDSGWPAFGDGEAQIHAVAVHGGGRAHHFGTVQTAVDVLPLEFLLGFVGQGLVVRAPFGQTHFPQGFEQDVLVKFLESNELDSSHRRPLFHHHHQHIAFGFQANVLEQTQGEQRADRSSAFFVRILVTHAQWQRSEDRTGFDPLQTLDTDVSHGERVNSPGGHARHQAGCHRPCGRLKA